MDIKISGLGKRYNFEWIFRNLNYELRENSELAIIGSNGSGKSTLAKILASFSPPTIGKLEYFSKENVIALQDVFGYLSFSAPYLELIEDFTLKEHFIFHGRFKTTDISFEEFIDKLKLTTAANKQIKFFSSGMKQRMKLGFAFFFKSELLILDEPSSNLDHQGLKWYKDEISKLVGTRTIVVCSNQEEEYDFCKNYLNVEKLK